MYLSYQKSCTSSSIHHHQFLHTDREGLHRTIKADIANSTNVSPAYTGNNIHYHIDQNRRTPSYHNYHYNNYHDNIIIIISTTEYEFVYNQTNSISPNYASFSEDNASCKTIIMLQNRFHVDSETLCIKLWTR